MEASAPERPLRVNTFLVASNLPLYVGQAKGFFKNRGAPPSGHDASDRNRAAER
jgi:ABC-type nitrate/sulfonate/bicarbonate transport system substrate-binding protein